LGAESIINASAAARLAQALRLPHLPPLPRVPYPFRTAAYPERDEKRNTGVASPRRGGGGVRRLYYIAHLASSPAKRQCGLIGRLWFTGNAGRPDFQSGMGGTHTAECFLFFDGTVLTLRSDGANRRWGTPTGWAPVPTPQGCYRNSIFRQHFRPSDDHSAAPMAAARFEAVKARADADLGRVPPSEDDDTRNGRQAGAAGQTV